MKSAVALSNASALKMLNLFTLILVATVTKIAILCWWQFVHIISTTVTNPDICRPSAAITGPVKTDFALDSPFRHCWMRATEPTRRMRTTMICCHTFIRHVCSCTSFKPIPLLYKRSSVAFDYSLVVFGTVIVIQGFVV